MIIVIKIHEMASFSHGFPNDWHWTRCNRNVTMKKKHASMICFFFFFFSSTFSIYWIIRMCTKKKMMPYLINICHVLNRNKTVFFFGSLLMKTFRIFWFVYTRFSNKIHCFHFKRYCEDQEKIYILFCGICMCTSFLQLLNREKKMACEIFFLSSR